MLTKIESMVEEVEVEVEEVEVKGRGGEGG